MNFDVTLVQHSVFSSRDYQNRNISAVEYPKGPLKYELCFCSWGGTERESKERDILTEGAIIGLRRNLVPRKLPEAHS